MERRERLEIEYFGAAREELTVRRIDPEHVFSALGYWYVVAWDHLSGAERLFRADRIRAIHDRFPDGLDPDFDGGLEELEHLFAELRLQLRNH